MESILYTIFEYSNYSIVLPLGEAAPGSALSRHRLNRLNIFVGVLRLTRDFIFPKVARAYLFPQSAKTHYFCSSPISVEPIYIYIYTYLYICRERERERERDVFCPQPRGVPITALRTAAGCLLLLQSL